MLAKLKIFMADNNIDYFLLPNSDEFFLEYLPKSKQFVKLLTNFSGSNAFVIFSKSKSYFFTDSRYFLQARNEINNDEFEILDISSTNLIEFISRLSAGGLNLALDPKYFNVVFMQKLLHITKLNLAKLDFYEIEEILDLNDQNQFQSEIYNINKNLVGVDSLTKRQAIAKEIKGDFMLVSKPENICWLLNLRSSDLENTPLLLAYGILFKDAKFDLFIDDTRIKNLEDENLVDVNYIQENCVDLRLNFLRKKNAKVQIDENYCNYKIYKILQDNNFEIICNKDPIEIAKAVKSDKEIESIKKAHIADGISLTKFLCWLQKSVLEGHNVDELSAAKKLLEFRAQNKAFLTESFPAISAFSSNASIIHYHPNEDSNKKIDNSNLYLIDSGGQYLATDFLGTTDITRTISFAKMDADKIANFTRVLKGHIALARVKFKKKTTGCNLDILARFHLLQDAKDYGHSTGHGVGCFLSVHEGPINISKKSHQELLPNMLISNEPGYYEDDKYGIRIENLVVVKEIPDQFLAFETISLAPIDPKLIDFKMLTYPERKWLKLYHAKIKESIYHALDDCEKEWLDGILKNYNNL